MRFRTLISILVAFIIIYMVITVAFAVAQPGLSWTWWWTIPLGGIFILLALLFRILVQRSQEDTHQRVADHTDQGLDRTPTGWPQ